MTSNGSRDVTTCDLGAEHRVCRMCRRPFTDQPRQVPPPYGSLSATHLILVCGPCETQLINVVRVIIDEPILPQDWRQ